MKKILFIEERLFNKNYLSKYISSDICVEDFSSYQTYDLSNCFVVLLVIKKHKLNHFNICYISNNKEYANSRIVSFNISELERIYATINNDFKNSSKKVHLYLGKFPGFGFDVDGGSILASQLIDTLKYRCQLDVSFIRKNNEEYNDPLVNNISYYPYKDALNNKFTRRMENLETNYNVLKSYNQYDIIIAAHISKLFLQKDLGPDFWKKTILFPMFCTSSYERSGETVPKEYTLLEQNVIDKVSLIITPSQEEKEDLIKDYNVDNINKIVVINRGINHLIKHKVRSLNNDKIEIINIGSTKKQKNQIKSLKILKSLLEEGIDTQLSFVTTIQDKEIYQNLLTYIKENQLSKRVKFYYSLKQNEVANLLKKASFNLSTSNWETFGRGIFEGACAGLPTIISTKLYAVKSIVKDNKGFFFKDSIKDYVSTIKELINNTSMYKNASQSTIEIAKIVSIKEEKEKLVKTIFEN